MPSCRHHHPRLRPIQVHLNRFLMSPLLSVVPLLGTNTEHPATKRIKTHTPPDREHSKELPTHFRTQFHPTQVGPTSVSHFSCQGWRPGPMSRGRGLITTNLSPRTKVWSHKWWSLGTLRARN